MCVSQVFLTSVMLFDIKVQQIYILFADEYDGDTLHGQPFPTVKYMRTEATPPEITPLTRGTEGNMFVSVEERERLMRAPLDSHSSENRKKTQDGNFEGTASRGRLHYKSTVQVFVYRAIPRQ